MQHWPLFELLYRHFGGGRGWAQGYLGRLLGHLETGSQYSVVVVGRLLEPRSVISANVKLALRCRSTFSE